MKKHSILLTALLTVLFAFTAVTAISVYAEEDYGGNSYQHQEITPDPNPGGNSSGNDSGNNGNDNDSGNDNDNGNHNNDNDNDSGYNNNSGNQNNSRDDDDDYDSGSNRNNNSYSNDNDDDDHSSGSSNDTQTYDPENYVGGGQVYTQPVSVPQTTAALYDTSKSKVDEQTLSNSDWNDISLKLKDTGSATAQNADTGDFAFIQKNSATEDNGHWLLIVGFTLMGVSIIGFIFLIANGKRHKKAVASKYRPVTASSNPRRAKSAPRYSAAEDDYDSFVREYNNTVSADDHYGDDYGDSYSDDYSDSYAEPNERYAETTYEEPPAQPAPKKKSRGSNRPRRYK